MAMYSEKVMEHFSHPRNVGEIKDADGVGKVGNITCGDIMWIFIKVGTKDDGSEFISDIKFKTLGCAAAIATSSMATEIAKGKTLTEALAITKNEIAEELGGLPPIKMHCSLLATDGLVEAIYDYYKKNGRKIPDDIEKRHRQILKEHEESCQHHS